MDIKYTLRDLIVYLLTGFTCATLVLIAEPSLITGSIASGYLKGTEISPVLIIAFGVPFLYMLGHLVQILDLIFTFHLVKMFSPLKKTGKLKKPGYFFLYGIYYFLASATAEFQYEKRMTQKEWLHQKFAVMASAFNNSVEYYYLLKELFNGLRTFLFLFLVYLLIGHHPLKIILLNTLLFFIFWIKAYNAAKNYTYEVTNLYPVLPPVSAPTAANKIEK